MIAEKPSVARDLARVLGVRAGRGAGDWFESEHYAITWCIGHLVELDEPGSYDPNWKPWRLDRLPMLPAQFRLRPAQHAKDQLRTVTKLLKDKRFASVINACDAGREGELIFRYVYQFANSRLLVRRLWISSLTDEAIKRGFSALRPGREYDALAAAACSRSEADWLVGMNATRAVTTRSRTSHGQSGDNTLFSIGRVQTPTLALLVRRENEIRAFVPKPYWEVRGDFRTESGATFQAPWRSGKQPRIATAELADQVVARDRDRGALSDPAGPRVVGLTAKTVREPAPQLFDLTTLQRTANRRFGFSAARTLELAQALYERHKVVTYPRTDSRHLSTDVARQLPPLFEALTAVEPYAPFAQRLVEQPPRPSARIVDDSKVSDHHAIIPTGSISRGMDRDESRLFDLIVRRFLGAFYPDAEIAVTEAWIRVCPGDGPPPAAAGTVDRETLVAELPPPPDHFLARGRVRMVAGWQEVAGIDGERSARGAGGGDSGGGGDGRDARGGRGRDDRDDEATSVLPSLAVGQHLEGAFSSQAKHTTPPSRHTEGTLLAAMESAGKHIEDEALRAAMRDVGLGTPATRAAIIETLLRRKYIVREKQHLVPTPMGLGLIATLVAAKVASLASPELTGSWEARLARVARGEESRASFMADIARFVVEVIDAIRGPSGSPMSMPPAPSPSSTTNASMPPPVSALSAPRLPEPVTAATSAKTGTAAKAPKAPKPAKAAKAPKAPKAAKPGAAKPGRAPKGEKTAPAHAAGAAAAITCPHCHRGSVIQGNRGWGCSQWREGCRFVIWFDRAAKTLSPAELRAVIASFGAQPGASPS